MAEFGKIVCRHHGMPRCPGDVVVFNQRGIIRLNDPSSPDLFTGPFDPVGQDAVWRCILTARNRRLTLGAGRLLVVSDRHAGIDAPRRRDLEHVVDPQTQPRLGAFEVLAHIPRLRQRMDVLETHRVPERCGLPLLFPLQPGRRAKAERPADERNPIGLTTLDCRQQASPRVHQPPTPIKARIRMNRFAVHGSISR